MMHINIRIQRIYINTYRMYTMAHANQARRTRAHTETGGVKIRYRERRGGGRVRHRRGES